VSGQKESVTLEQEVFSLPRSLKFAWLLRQDVRGKRDVEDVEAQKDFILWWVLYGQKEYPEVEPISNKLKKILFELLPDYPRHGWLGISRLLIYIYQLRSDVQELYDIQTIEGVVGFNQWFYLYGLKEHKLLSLLSSDVIIMLNEPMMNFRSLQINQELPELSLLMFFLWFDRKDIHNAFDIDTVEGRERYLGWFFLQGVPELGLQALIDNDRIQWLKERVFLSSTLYIKRVGLLFWQFREDIRNSFDLNDQDGLKGLINWTEHTLSTELKYQWLNQKSSQLEINLSDSETGNSATYRESNYRSINKKNTQLGVNLIGFAFGELGIGEDVRMAAAVCESAGIPYTVINISPGNEVRQNDLILLDAITEQLSQLKYKTNIFCLTGFDTVHVYLEKGRQLFENRYNIGWWPWELPVWPEQWSSAFDLIDEVWAATTYTQAMYQRSTDKLVTLMPLPVSVTRAVPVTRGEMGLANNKFLFLYIFDFNS